MSLSSNNGVCIPVAGASGKYTFGGTAVPINTTGCLTQSVFDGPCLRTLVYGSAGGAYGSHSEYSSTDCTGIATSINLSPTWELTKAANKWTLRGIYPITASWKLLFFYGEIATVDPVDCYTDLEFTNQLTDAATNSVGGMTVIPTHYGGTAVLTTCCA